MLRFIPLLLLIYPLYQLYQLYLNNKSHKRKMKNISDWGDFNKQCLEWAEEIKDQSIKNEYLNYLFEKISLYNTAELFEDSELFNTEKSKQEIVEKYGKHISSLMIEIRDEKINEILSE